MTHWELWQPLCRDSQNPYQLKLFGEGLRLSMSRTVVIDIRNEK